MKSIAFISFLILSSFMAMGQLSHTEGMLNSIGEKRVYRDTVWTIKGATILDERYKKWKFDIALDGRQTLVSGSRARLLGVRLGLEHRRVHRFGVGIYNLGDGIPTNSLNQVDPRIENAVLSLAYASVFYERVMLFNKRWEWSITGHLGAGEISGNYKLKGSETIYSYSQTVRPMEISSTLYYNLTYFISIGTGVGYRYMRSTPEELRPLYNAPVGILRVRIKLIKMVRGFFNEEVRRAF